MSKQDDRLEGKLKAMEEGEQPEKVIEGSSNSSELKSLVSLAASISDLPHPELDQQTIQSEKRRIISAAREKNRARHNSKPTKSSGFTGLWLFVPAVAGVALIMLMVFVLAAGVGLYFSGPSGAQAATLTDAAGVLEVSDSGFAGDWRLVSNGDEVRSGQRLRTGDESWVTLEFFDGTQMTLAPKTDVVLNKVEGNWGDELQVELIQNQGETNHQVVPLQGDEATYQVFTPSGEASVRGTSFSVLVENTGISLFTVETGEVLVSNDGFETNLAAGQGVVTELGVEIASPSYLFTLQGVLKDNTGKTWQVENVKFTVKGGTFIVGDPQETDFVEVHGRIKKNGEWVADSITKLGAPVLPEGILTGVVTSKGPDSLSIGRYSFDIIGPIPDVAVGDLVRVTFTIDNEVWEINTLEILDGAGLPDQDDDPDAGPELSFKDDEIKITACEMSPELPSTTLNYKTDDEKALPLDVLLSADIIEGEEEGLVTGVLLYLDPNGGALDLNNPISIPRGTPVEIFIQVVLAEGVGILEFGDEIKVHVMAKGTLDGEDLTDDFKIKWECEEEDDDDDDEGKGGHYCTTDDEHPHAATLADEYAELLLDPYNDIMDWFCNDNLGFGEIELAFKLYYKFKDDLPLGEIEDVYDIIDLRLNGKGWGWGQIKHEMARLAREAQIDDEPEAKKEPPGKQKSEEAKNKEKPNKKNKNDD
jgi:hypothetical protein